MRAGLACPLVLAAVLLLPTPSAGRKHRNRRQHHPVPQWCDPVWGPRQIPMQGHLPEVAPRVSAAVCDYIGAAPAPRRLSLGRWTPAVEAKLLPHVQAIELALSAQRSSVLAAPVDGQLPWVVFRDWIDAIADESEAFELRALSAPIHERVAFELLNTYGMFVTTPAVPTT